MLNFNVDVKELEDLIRKVVAEEIAKSANNNREDSSQKFIRGINGLAEYLGISRSKAQKLKNNCIVPYTQDGRLILFDPVKVDEALAQKTPRNHLY